MNSHDVRTTCNRDCPDSCGIIATIEGGRITAHKGDPAHGVTRGFLCSQGRDYLKRQYHPQRVVHPQRRTDRGWQRLSWDDALELAAEKLSACKAQHGPLSVLALTYSGFQGHLQKFLAKLFWSHFGGATTAEGGLSVEPIHAAQHLDFGAESTHLPEDLVHSKAFVLWGKNPVLTRQHWIPFIDQARKNGARIYVIDPIPSATAQRADRHFALRPGTDRFLAIGVARLLLEQDAVDDEFVRDHAQGFDQYRRVVMGWSLDEIARIVDLPRQAIEELAEVYARRKPVSTQIGLGVCYWRHGGEAVRFLDALAAISGNLGIAGGGIGTDLNGGKGLGAGMSRLLAPCQRRTVRMPMLGQEVAEAREPRLRVGWIAGANPAATAPDTHRVREALRSLEFLVVVDQFMTASAQTADLLLPCTTYLEAEDVVSAYGHNWIGMTRKVVEPEGEARSDAEIYQALAARLGFGEALAGTPESWLRRLVEPVTTWERLLQGAQQNPRVLPVPLADKKFGTRSGKFEFVGAVAAHEPDDSLHLLAAKSRRMINSQALPEDLPEAPWIRVHPETLARHGLRDGFPAVVVSRVGEVRVHVKADDTLRKDVVVFSPARWKGELSGVNQLREAVMTDLGCGAAMHETRVHLVAAE